MVGLRSKKGLSFPGVAVFFVAALLVIFALSYAIDCVFNPWAHSPTGKPTLTGTWVGHVTTASGQARALFLDLRRSTNRKGNYSTCRGCPRMEGAAKLCGGEAGVIAYEIWGGPDDWGGTRFHLSAGQAKGQPVRAGLQASGMRGEWSGGDALGMALDFSRYDERGASHSRSDDVDVNQPAKFTMARGVEGDFQMECAKLGAAAGK